MGGNPRGDVANKFSKVLRGVVCALVVLLAACAGVQAQADKQAPEVDPLHTATRQELDVAKAIVAEQSAWNRGDLDGFVKGFKDSPETVFMGKLVLEGYAQIEADFKHNYPTAASMGAMTYSEVEVHSLGENFAVCLGKYHLERAKKEGGSADGSFSMVLEKTGAGWKIVLDHTT
jgi:ketosteroid isomerase-like protein